MVGKMPLDEFVVCPRLLGGLFPIISRLLIRFLLSCNKAMRNSSMFFRYAITLFFAIQVLILPYAVEAAEMTANNGSVGLRYKDVDLTWKFTTPSGFEDIKWFTGENTADGLTFNKRSAGAEAKFIRNPLRGRGWNGFYNIDRGPQGSRSVTSGEGGSYEQNYYTFRPKWNAEFRLVADGVLGRGKGAVGWSSTATGEDPFFVFPSDLSEIGVMNGTFDLLLTQSLDALTLSDSGWFEWRSYLETSSGMIDILSISGGINGVTLIGNQAVTYFRQPTGAETDVDELVELTLADISQQLNGVCQLNCVTVIHTGTLSPNIMTN